MRPTPLLHADLHDLFCAVHRPHNALAFRDVVSQRLLDVYILSGGERVMQHVYMPMVRGADHDGVEIFAIEQFAIVGIHVGARRRFLFCLVHIRPIGIAHGQDIGVADLVDNLE